MELCRPDHFITIARYGPSFSRYPERTFVSLKAPVRWAKASRTHPRPNLDRVLLETSLLPRFGTPAWDGGISKKVLDSVFFHYR